LLKHRVPLNAPLSHEHTCPASCSISVALNKLGGQRDGITKRTDRSKIEMTQDGINARHVLIYFPSKA